MLLSFSAADQRHLVGKAFDLQTIFMSRVFSSNTVIISEPLVGSYLQTQPLYSDIYVGFHHQLLLLLKRLKSF